MKHIFIFLLLLSGRSAKAQSFFTSFYGGVSGYKGDLQVKLFSLKNTHPAWGLGLLLELNDWMLIRGDFTYGKISGQDGITTQNRSRNLNFFSNITEFSIGFEYVMINLYEYKVSPYFFTGIARFNFSPQTKDKNGNPFSLFDLSTEGQGFYQDRKPYKLRQFSIPLGGGVQWALSDNVRIGYVIGIRKTFTDYLDDVSLTYIDPVILQMKRGGTAVAYAYRGDELPGGAPYPPDGTPRGNPKKKDWYTFSGLSIRVRIAPKGKTRVYTYRKGKAKVSCPKPF